MQTSPDQPFLQMSLTLEQQLELAKCRIAVKKLSEKDCQQKLIELMRQSFIVDNQIRHFFKQCM